MKEKLTEQKNILKNLVDQYTRGELFNLKLQSFFSTIDAGGKIWILGAGKASVEMARQAESYFGEQVKDGIVIAEISESLERVQVFEGAHPLPDEDSISASYELCNLAKNIPAGDTVIFCLSGGASSLFCIPPENVETDELQSAWKMLLECGADIHEINVVRKHISISSGGRLGKLLSNTNLHSIILSDVPGDDPQTIGSGPTVEDGSTYKEAFQILKKYKLWDRVAHSIRIHISRGIYGGVEETPDKLAMHHAVYVIPGARLLAESAAAYLEKQGYSSWLKDSAYSGEVRKVSKEICSKAIGVLSGKDELKKPAALIYYGESTVEVEGEGKGGRNMELALIAALSLEGQHPLSMLSLATDGKDGPTDAAGALINSKTTLDARKKKLIPEDYLQRNDSYHFHRNMETLLKTGSTGNNVMDLQVVLIG